MDQKITKDMVLDAAASCGTKGEFTRRFMKYFIFAKNENILNEFYDKLPDTKTKFTKEILQHEALKYTTRSAFSYNARNFYEAARRLGFLDTICEHMLPVRLSFGQRICEQIFNSLLGNDGLYNDRVILHPLELDLYYPKYEIAIEYQGLRWHSTERAITNDRLKKELCQKNGILLICIYESTKSHEDQIPIIKNQIKSNLSDIKGKIGRNVEEKDVDNVVVDMQKIYDSVSLQNLHKVIAQYSSLKDFSANEPGLYDCVRKIKRMDLLEHFRERKYPIKWHDMTDDEVFSLIVKDYSSYSDFRKNEIYRTIMRRRKLQQRVMNYFAVQSVQ